MLLLSLAMLAACQNTCQSDTRMNGDYAVWSYVTAPTEDLSGQNIADYPWPGMFFNGWSEWSLEYVSGQSTVNLSIDDQPFAANFTRVVDDCRNFTLDFDGTYLTDVGSTHAFVWHGDLAYQGPEISGTWSYKDTWSNVAEGTSGSVDVPLGELSMTAGGKIGDTGR
ncbi:MAG: hypothetical protein GXP62_17000 [Oligoflexia bacterium]|nr:hypothetical protein [Oligoflexia bacterium]